jgi:hypothetical protein
LSAEPVLCPKCLARRFPVIVPVVTFAAGPCEGCGELSLARYQRKGGAASPPPPQAVPPTSLGPAAASSRNVCGTCARSPAAPIPQGEGWLTGTCEACGNTERTLYREGAEEVCAGCVRGRAIPSPLGTRPFLPSCGRCGSKATALFREVSDATEEPARAHAARSGPLEFLQQTIAPDALVRRAQAIREQAPGQLTLAEAVGVVVQAEALGTAAGLLATLQAINDSIRRLK